jgi:hypothetical protein
MGLRASQAPAEAESTAALNLNTELAAHDVLNEDPLTRA